MNAGDDRVVVSAGSGLGAAARSARGIRTAFAGERPAARATRWSRPAGSGRNTRPAALPDAALSLAVSYVLGCRFGTGDRSRYRRRKG